MSSQDKDPLEKQDTPPESIVSHPDSEKSKEEENRELQERLTKAEQKDDSVESEPLSSSYEEGSIESKVYPMSEPIAGQSEESSFEISGVKSDPGPECVGLSGFQKEKDVGENTGAKLVETDSDTTESSTPPFIQSSPSTSLSRKKIVPIPIPIRKHLELQKRLMESSSESISFASDSAHSSLDVPEICSEVASLSGEGRERPDAPEDQPPGHVPALGRGSSEDSDANISELPEVSGVSYPSPPTVTHTSESITTSSKEYHEQSTRAQIRRQAGKRSIQSLPEIPSSKPVPGAKKWRSLGEVESCRIDVDHFSVSSTREVSEHGAQGEDLQSASEPSEVQEILQHERKQSFDRKSSADSTEPMNTSSDEPHQRKSSEIKDSNESPKPQTGRKSWQKSGCLRSMQLPAVTSKDMDLLWEENDPSPELMETGGNDESPEEMDTTSDKSVAGVAEKTGLSESKSPALESSDQANVSEAAGLFKVEELSIEVENFERKAEKSKRPEAKLSSSSLSEEILDSSSPKKAIDRPQKKARLEKKRRTRHDSNDSLPESVGPDFLNESESSPSDSPDEKVTRF